MARPKCSKCKEKIDDLLCQCCQTNLFVDNGLLMYVSSYSSRAPRLTIKNAVMNFYSSDAITTARQIVEDSVRDIVSDHPAIGVKRTDSVRRTASDAMLDDILDFLSALDKVDGVAVPKFVCSDARELPPAGPEDGGSLMSVLEAVASQQRQMKQMQESMNEMRIDLMKLQAKESAASTEEVSVVASETMVRGKQGSDQKEPLSHNEQKNNVTKETPAPSNEHSRSNRLYSGAVQRPPQIPSNIEGFKPQVKRPNKGSSRDQGKSKKQTSKGGTSDSGSLRAGPSTFQVQITNVNSDLNDEDIKAYLTSKEVQASNIEDTTSPGWETKRFLLTFSYENFDKVMNVEFWPRKIYFKRWFPAKVKNSQINNGQ